MVLFVSNVIMKETKRIYKKNEEIERINFDEMKMQIHLKPTTH